jgi:hypothetical protein
LKINQDNKDGFGQLRSAAEKHTAMEKKLDELITLLNESDFDSETIKHYKSKVNSALEDKITADDLKAFEAIDEKIDASREELLDDFSTLLESHKFNSKSATQYLKVERSNKIIFMAIGVMIIFAGIYIFMRPLYKKKLSHNNRYN